MEACGRHLHAGLAGLKLKQKATGANGQRWRQSATSGDLRRGSGFALIPRCFMAAKLSKRCTRKSQNDARREPNQRSRKCPGLWWACVAALPGSFQYGWALSVINVPQSSICASLALADSSFAWSLLVAILSPSALLGAWLGPAVVRRFGLVRALRSTAAFFVISGLLFPLSAKAASSSLSLAYGLFALGRIVAGIGGGAATVFVPLYLGQIAPLELRGAIGNLHQVAIVFGLLVAQLAGASLSWPCALALAASFGIVQILLMPRLLGIQEQRAQESDGTEAIGANTGFQALLTDSRVRRPLYMAIILMALQQYSGINGIWFYSTEFFARAGLSNPLAGTLLSSLVFMLATFLSVPLIEQAGRRALMLRGQAGALLSLSLLTMALCVKSVGCLVALQSYLNMLVVTAVLGFVTSFAISLGPIPWQIANEIFPLRCRAEAQCLIASFCEVFNASVALGFPVLQRCLGSQLAFAPSILVLLAGILVVKKNLPETKNREVEDILVDFNRRT
ncbi:SLC2A1 [Symbiodinium sp. CCMP2456]|nr:SLC2A1 [Symbiodinium sp. CCMP2456]